MKTARTTRLAAAGLACIVGLAACGGSDDSATDTPGGGGGRAAQLGAVTLNGSGSTFAKAFFEANIEAFGDAQPNVTVNYGGGGSGKGRTDLQTALVDFAGTDGLVKDEDKPKYKGSFLYVPTVAAPITVSYNLGGVKDLTLDADTLGKIFQRDIKSWDDPAIKALNPSATLPSKSIVVAHRSDGSGTTEQFTKYLVKAAPSWKLKSGSTVEWPADTQAGNGNAGVAQIVKAQDGAIGYVDLADANTQQLSTAKLKNKSGAAVAPTLEATTAALEAVQLKDDLTYDSLDSANAAAYPIASPTWVMVYKDQADRAKGAAVKAFLTFLLTDGQKLAKDNDYAPLPTAFIDKAKAAVDSIVVPAYGAPDGGGGTGPPPVDERSPMATVTPTDARISLRRGRRRPADRGFRVLATACSLLVLVVLVLIAVSTTNEAMPAFRAEGLGFVTDARWAPNEGRFGALAFVFGTMFVSAIALVFAVPVSMGIALFISELAGKRTRRVATFVIDLLAAVPSVVFGLWGVAVLAAEAPDVYRAIGEPLQALPGVGGVVSEPFNGKSFLSAGLILALMITPIITSITREVLDTTPAGQREAALALGATRWEMIRGAVLPHARGGAIGAILLGLGRAMGETIAAALVIGSGSQITLHLFASGDSMAARVANEFGEATGTWRSALVGLGVVLFAMTIVVNLLAAAIVAHAERRTR